MMLSPNPHPHPPTHHRSWHFGAEAMCEYSQREFEEGMAGLGCDSIDKLKGKLPQLRAELQASQGGGHPGIARFGWLLVALVTPFGQPAGARMRHWPPACKHASRQAGSKP